MAERRGRKAISHRWGELCASREVASAWADRLIGITRLALSPDRNVRGYFHGTTACLSALHHEGRYEELVELVETETLWPYKAWGVRARAAMGSKAEAIRYAEDSRGSWTSDPHVDAVCEEILLSSGRSEEAYACYGLRANRRGTYLATFRAVAEKYPQKGAAEILADLVAAPPGEEGKWFAAAKEAGLYDEALAVARRSPCDPRTLTRAARDFAETEPAFAVEAGLLALDWLARGHGYEITGADVGAAIRSAMQAAEKNDTAERTLRRIEELVASGTADEFVARAVRRELES